MIRAHNSIGFHPHEWETERYMSAFWNTALSITRCEFCGVEQSGANLTEFCPAAVQINAAKSAAPIQYDPAFAATARKKNRRKVQR